MNMRCPYCQTELPRDARECTHCDWVRPSEARDTLARDWCAALLSFVPGLGHLYKGHLVSGIILLCLAGPFFLLVVMLLVPVTLGLSLLLPAVFIAFTAVHAFRLPDVREHPGVLAHATRTLEQWMRLVHRNHP
jgi:hypothetical protein